MGHAHDENNGMETDHQWTRQRDVTQGNNKQTKIRLTK